jgi:3-oxoacyl-[acyl-carrier protein] reductase
MGKILVTGGAKGIGAAVVSALVAAGHDVVFTYRSSREEADRVIAGALALHPQRSVSARSLDLSDAAAVNGFAESLEAEGGYLGFVHVAGQTYDTLAAVMDAEKAQAVMQVNLFAATRIVNALVREMSRARKGRIVFMGSVTALQANVGNAAYAASKGALLAYARTLAIESARRGVTVNYVAPGFVKTDMMAGYAAYHETMQKQIPAGRFATPEDVAGMVAFLISDQAAYVTGAVLPVDGGLTVQIGVHR